MHGVLADTLLGLGFGDLHFCKIESATNSDGRCQRSGCRRLVFYVRLNINEKVTTKNGPRAPSSHGRFTMARALRLTFPNANTSCLYEMVSATKSERCQSSTFTTTKNGPHAPNSRGSFIWARVWKFTFF
jgi:hypothetical protein